VRNVPAPKFMKRCVVCGCEFQFGIHVYDGKYIPTYEIMVCSGCYQANWDGWAPDHEPAVTRKLREQGKPIPERNEKGWLPRD
jgi:hypothetical protein